MKIVLVRGSCNNGRTCPNVNISDRGTFVVQGYVATADPLLEQEITPAEAVVEIPLSLMPELAGAASRAGLYLTDRGTVLVQGTQVIDPEALVELDLPAGENAVEISMSMFPELDVANA
jgi:hypothetical protein